MAEQYPHEAEVKWFAIAVIGIVFCVASCQSIHDWSSHAYSCPVAQQEG